MKKIPLYLWQLPQHVLAWLLLLFLLLFRAVDMGPHKYGSWFFRPVKWKFGVALGEHIFMWEGTFNDWSLRHEYGHVIQSRALGPLYLLIVGIPSITQNILTRLGLLDARTYYDRWPEDDADRLSYLNWPKREEK